MKTSFKKSLLTSAILASSALSAQAFAVTDCTGVEEWQANKTYTGGKQTQEAGKLYQANWWTRGSAPSAHSGPWQEWDFIDSCGMDPIDYYVPGIELSGIPQQVEQGQSFTLSVIEVGLTAEGFEPYPAEKTVILVDGAEVPSKTITINDIGNHTITVQVTYTDDARTVVTESASVLVTEASQENIAPMVNLTAPTGNADLTDGDTVQLKASASDSDGDVVKVDFYVDDALLASDASAPYQLNWTAEKGIHSIKAKATDNQGAATLSTEVTITVKEQDIVDPISGCGDIPEYETGTQYAAGDLVFNANEKFECKIGGWCSSNAAWAYAPGEGAHWADAWEGLGVCSIAPDVAITSPADNSVLLSGTDLTIAAAASDEDGSISMVEFFVNDVSLGSDSSEPFTADWVANGNADVQLKAIATDNDGNASDATVLVTVSDEPVVTALTSPSSGSKVGLGNSITLAANASSVVGTITKVEFFVNGQAVGSDSAAPYSLQWTPSVVGDFTVTAKTTDSKGNVASSSGATVSVVEVVESEHLLVGYWHNFNNPAGCPIDLGDISPAWDVIDIAFADNDRNSNGTVHFNLYAGDIRSTCAAIDPVKFKADVAALRAQGKKVVLSLGGAEGNITLNTDADEANFVSSLTDIIKEWGFDGLDVDLESGSNLLHGTEIQKRLGRALLQIEQNIGGDMYLTMAPEHPYVQGGMIAYTGIWGAYIPVINDTRSTLDLLHVQLYNNGGLPHPYNGGQNALIGSVDMMVASAKMLIEGFELADGSMFEPLLPSQVSLGLPSGPKAAGSGQATNANIIKALDCLTAKTNCDTISPNEAYPSFSGVMTWSINWDIYDGYIFSGPIGDKVHSLPKK